jgi:hypothetical protein
LTIIKEAAMPKRESNKPAEKTARKITVRKRSSVSQQPTRENIERRAYEIYMERGGGEGYEMEDWLQAERELTKGTKKVGD